MATTLHATGTFPAGFSTPFKRVPMEERIDDAFACVATLTNRTLAEVTGAAVKLGYPANGPAWATYPLIGKLLSTLNNLTSNDYKEFQDLGTLPDVAILLVNYDPDTEIGRHVVWHHVRATETVPSFHYIIDPAHWLDVKHHMTRDLRHLDLKGAYYIEVKQQSYAAAKGK